MLTLRLAESDDVEKVGDMYARAAALESSVWNKEYPTVDFARNDFEHWNLFVFEEDGKLIGACSAETVSEIDDLDFWRVREDAVEIARIVIDPEYQGRGLAKEMVGRFIDVLSERGFKAIHLLAAKANPAAVRTYKSLGFEYLGECFAFGHDYYAAELAI